MKVIYFDASFAVKHLHRIENDFANPSLDINLVSLNLFRLIKIALRHFLATLLFA